MDVRDFLDAVAAARLDGCTMREWSVYSSESRGLSLGIKDRQIGNAHVPLKLGESRGAQFKDWIHAIALSGDATLLAAADMAGQVNVWKLA